MKIYHRDLGSEVVNWIRLIVSYGRLQC